MVFIVVLYVSMPVRIYSDLGMLLQHVALHFSKKKIYIYKRNNKKKHMCVWDAPSPYASTVCFRLGFMKERFGPVKPAISEDPQVGRLA